MRLSLLRKRPQEIAEAASAGTALFERMLKDIMSGFYPSGTRLPPERDLAITLGASRPTLREVLRRLSEWRLVEIRHGSGVAVRPKRDWSLEALPAYLRYGAAGKGPEELAAVIRDLLAVRKSLIVEVMRIVGPRLAGRKLSASRTRVEAAWNARADVGKFVQEDFEVVRSVVEAADLLPALWLMGSLAGVYSQIAAHLVGGAPISPDYRRSYEIVLDALETGNTKVACAALAAYFDRHDRRLLAGLGIRT